MSQIPGLAPGRTNAQAYAEQQADGLGGVNLDIPVRIVYSTDDPDAQPFKMTYARRDYYAVPNDPRGVMVPYLLMCMYMGDPRAFDVPGDKMELKHRRKELERLRVHWGVYDREEAWLTLPKLTAYPLDSDVPFNTVLDDPEGMNLDPTSIQVSETAYLREELERQKGMMMAMQAQLQMREMEQTARQASGLGDDGELVQQMTEQQVAAPEIVPPPPGPTSQPRSKGQPLSSTLDSLRDQP